MTEHSSKSIWHKGTFLVETKYCKFYFIRGMDDGQKKVHTRIHQRGNLLINHWKLLIVPYKIEGVSKIRICMVSQVHKAGYEVLVVF